MSYCNIVSYKPESSDRHQFAILSIYATGCSNLRKRDNNAQILRPYALSRFGRYIPTPFKQRIPIKPKNRKFRLLTIQALNDGSLTSKILKQLFICFKTEQVNGVCSFVSNSTGNNESRTQ